MSKDYYETLGVNKNATKQEIKKAYKKLALKFHPDRAPDDKKKEYEEKFKGINEAASVLADDEKKANYDKFGSEGAGGAGFKSGFEGFDFSEFMHDSFDFDDIFDTFFGGGGFFRNGHRAPRKGSDLLYNLEIELEDAAFGAKKQIIINKFETCDQCNGTGAKSASDIKTCDNCQGAGYQRRTQRTPFGVFSTTAPCNICRGEGKVITSNCSKCQGKKRVEVEKKIEVDVPKGIANGFKLRLSGEGEASEDGVPGDLYISIHIKPHSTFERKDDDIFLEAPISFSEAALGTEIEVPILNSKATLKVPAGTQTDTQFKMKGKGIPHLQGYGVGSQIVKVIVETPEKLTKKQKDIFKQLAKESKHKGFFKRIKSVF